MNEHGYHRSARNGRAPLRASRRATAEWRRVSVVAAFLGASAAPAQARADAKSAADALFQEGTQLIAAGQVDEACPKFVESQKLDPALGTLLYLAACHEKQGLTASAWHEFQSATEWAQRTNQPDRVLFGRRHMASLESNLSTVAVRVPTIDGIEVRVDGGNVGAATLAAPFPLDPGEHAIEATAPGCDPWHTTIVVPARPGVLTIAVPSLTPHPDPPSAPDVPAPEAIDEPLPVAPAHSGLTTLTWSAAGVAGASLVVGSIFGAMTFAARDSAKSECPDNRCVPGGLEDIDRARTYATVSTVGFGVGLVAAAATGYFFLRSSTPPGHSTSKVGVRAIAIAPSVSPRQAGVAFFARFE